MGEVSKPSEVPNLAQAHHLRRQYHRYDTVTR